MNSVFHTLGQRAALIKLGIAENQEQEDTPSVLLPAGLMGGGALAASKAKPLVTGRTRLYHGTTPEVAQKIRAEGLRPSADVSTPAITDLLTPDIQSGAKKMVYLTPSKREAGGYAGQAEFIAQHPENFLDESLGLERGKSTLKGQIFPGEGVVAADVLLWHPSIADKQRINPEARGSYEEFKQHILNKSPQLADAPDWLVNLVAKPTRKSLLNAEVLEGGLPPEFIRGSEKFKGLGLQELSQYARTHPGRFAGGVGLGALGLGTLGLGAYKAYNALNKPE